MRKIDVRCLKAGYKLGKTIYNASGNVLLKAGVVLTNKYIDNLIRLGIPSVYIKDKFTEDLIVEDVIPDSLRINTIRQVKDAFERNQNGLFSLQNSTELQKSVQDIVQELISNKDALVNIVDVRSYDDYTYAHSVNTCVLSVLTGISMGHTKATLYHLGMGALLHDLGKIQIPKHVLNKPGRLTDEEFSIIKQHATFSYNSLIKQDCVSNLSALISYEHHEKYDGSGYPRGLMGDEIHPLSQIVGMVDIFDALTADRIYRKAYPVNEACELIAAAGDYYFSYEIILPFLSNIAPYPIGTLVELSNGCLGVVVRADKGFPANPVVRIVTDELRKPIKPFEMDLTTNLNIVISRVMPEEELTALN